MHTTGLHSLFTTRLASASHFLLLTICCLLLLQSAPLAQRGGGGPRPGAAQEWLDKYYLPLPALDAPYGVYADARAQAYAAEVFELTNQQRQKKGHTLLTRNSYLDAIAQAHAVHMAEADFFEHRSPLGMNPNHRIDAIGAQQWRTYGENIAAGYATPQRAIKEWMDSSGHRKAIRNEDFREIGIGVYYDARTKYGWYWVQVFATFDGRFRSRSGSADESGQWLLPGRNTGQGASQRFVGHAPASGAQAVAPQQGKQPEPGAASAELKLPAPPQLQAAGEAPLVSEESEDLVLEATDDGPDWEAARPLG